MKRSPSFLRRCLSTLPLHFFRDRRSTAKRKSSRIIPQLEILEDRVVPTNITWTGHGTTGNWSDGGNWSGGHAPGATDTAIFNNTSIKSAIVDTGYAGTVGSIQIDNGYTGSITLKKALSDAGFFSQAAGAFKTNNFTLSVGGDVSLTGGTFTNTTGTLNLDGGSTSLDAPTAALGNVTVNASGTVTTTSNTLAVSNLTLNSGTFVAPTGNLTIVHNLTTTSGAFDANGGTLVFDTTSGGHAININGGVAGLLTVNNLDFGDGGTGTRSYTIAAGDGFYINGTFTVSSSTATMLVNGGIFDVTNPFTPGTGYKAGKPTPVFHSISSSDGAISGVVYDDETGSGQEQSTDPGLLGWTVNLYDGNGIFITSMTTGSTGGYSFLNLAPGTYSVQEVPQAGYTAMATPSNPITVTARNNASANFGNFQNFTIAGTVFSDANGDAQQQLNELGIPNLTVQLYTVTNGVVSANPLQTTTTDVNGNYSFTNLGPLAAGVSYVVAQVAPGGTSQTKPTSGNTITLPDGRIGWLVPATGGVAVNLSGQPDPDLSGTGSYTLKKLNNSTKATVRYNDGTGHSGSESAYLSQFNVTFNNGVNAPVNFNTFCIDLEHTVRVGGTYAVSVQPDLAPTYVNAGPMAYIFQNFGMANLSNNSDQAAAVQVALWDLSLNDHTPTEFIQDTDGTYSSGDENVFSVNFGSNPNAAAIATLVNQYLHIAAGETDPPNGWLERASNAVNGGQNILLPQTLNNFGDQVQATTQIRTSDPQTGNSLLQTGNTQFTVPLNFTQSPPDT